MDGKTRDDIHAWGTRHHGARDFAQMRDVQVNGKRTDWPVADVHVRYASVKYSYDLRQESSMPLFAGHAWR